MIEKDKQFMDQLCDAIVDEVKNRHYAENNLCVICGDKRIQEADLCEFCVRLLASSGSDKRQDKIIRKRCGNPMCLRTPCSDSYCDDLCKEVNSILFFCKKQKRNFNEWEFEIIQLFRRKKKKNHRLWGEDYKKFRQLILEKFRSD